uniref:Uncharacterized protein n=1 Tax=Glossina austeni TaxID=7395 RepID=A0A1A9VRB4_GLOAU
MSDEVPSGRLSQIFDTLTNLQTNPNPSSSLSRTRNAAARRSTSSSPSPSTSGRLTPASAGSGSVGSGGSGGGGTYHLHNHPQTYQYLTQTHNYFLRPQDNAEQNDGAGRHALENSSSPPCSSTGLQCAAQSTPNSPRLMPRRTQRVPPIPVKPSNVNLSATPSMTAEKSERHVSGAESDASWPHLSTLTDYLDVHQVNNYPAGAMPEINWQERCLELQLELHRSKNQAGRIRDMLREKNRVEVSDNIDLAEIK